MLAYRKLWHTHSKPRVSAEAATVSVHLYRKRCLFRHRVVARASDNYYELLGIDIDASDEDIKAAFRRRAKELHPDVNKDEDAEDAFMQCSEAYQTLADPDKRAVYDRENSLRRMNFFRDVDVDEPIRTSPFRWSDIGQDSDDEEDEEGPGRAGQPGGAADRDPIEFMEDLARLMGTWPDSPMRQWSRGVDPWGTSSSDAWHRRVQQQRENPFYRGGRPPAGDDDNLEWQRPGSDDFRKRSDWEAPGRGSEWEHPRRRWDEEDRKGGPGKQGPGGGDFRRPFKI